MTERIYTFARKQDAMDDFLVNNVWKNVFPLRTFIFQNDVDGRRWELTVSAFASLEDVANYFASIIKGVIKCKLFPCLRDQEETSFKDLSDRRARSHVFQCFRARSHVFRLVPNEEGYVTVHIPQKEEFNVFQKEMENRLIPENKVTVCVEAIETPCHISKKDEEACWVRRETEKRLASWVRRDTENKEMENTKKRKMDKEVENTKKRKREYVENTKKRQSENQLERQLSKIRRTLRAERALFEDSDDEGTMIDDVSHHMDSEFLYDWKIVKHLEKQYMVLIERNGVQREMDWRYLRPIVMNKQKKHK